MLNHFLIIWLALFYGQAPSERLCQEPHSQLVRLSAKEMKGRLTFCERAKLDGSWCGKGMIGVLLTVDAEGKVICVTALNGHPLMKDLAAKTAQSWKFKPLEQNGERVTFKGVVMVSVNWDRSIKDSCSK